MGFLKIATLPFLGAPKAPKEFFFALSKKFVADQAPFVEKSWPCWYLKFSATHGHSIIGVFIIFYPAAGGGENFFDPGIKNIKKTRFF